MIYQSASIALRHYRAILLDLSRRPKFIATHILIATLCGLLFLPGLSSGYATLTVDGRVIAYNSDSIVVIVGGLFSIVYPVVGFVLLSSTLRAPVPESLLSSFPIKRITLLLGYFLASASLLAMHLLFVSVAGVLRSLPINSAIHLPLVFFLSLIISFPSIIATSALSAIAEVGILINSKSIRVYFVGIWLIWVAISGLVLASVIAIDVTGIGTPFKHLLGDAAVHKISVGFVANRTPLLIYHDINHINLTYNYAMSQVIRSMPYIFMIILFGVNWVRSRYVRQENVEIRNIYSFYGTSGFVNTSILFAWFALMLGMLGRLFRGGVRLSLAAGLIAGQVLTTGALSEKMLYVTWSLYLTRWCDIGRIVTGHDFLDLERSLPLGGWRLDSAAIVAVSIQMLILSSGRLISYLEIAPWIVFEIAIISFSAVFLLRVTKSETPFLVLALIWWYALISR